VTLFRGFPWRGHQVFLSYASVHGDTPAQVTPYWLAAVDGTVFFTGVEAHGVENVGEVTELVKRWIDEGALPYDRSG
jgi:hypothetical protein